MITTQNHPFPACHFDYRVTQSDNSTWIDIYAHFDRLRYTTSATQSEAVCMENAQRDLITWRTESEKLADQEVKLYLQTSMDNNSLHELNKQAMSAYIGRIINFLGHVGKKDLLMSKAVETPLFSQEIGITNENAYFKQQVLVFSAKDESKEQLFVPEPMMKDDSAGHFVSVFQQAFKGRYKIAVAEDAPDLWVLDTSRKQGVYEIIDSLYYFAPAPLSNTLIHTEDIALDGYMKGMPFPFGDKQMRRFTAVSIDDWAQQFLLAIQSMRSPKYLNLLTAVNKEIAVKLQAVSGSLANAIAVRMVKMMDANLKGGSLEQAVKSFTQIITNNLISAYGSEGVIVQQESAARFTDLKQGPLRLLLPDLSKEEKPVPALINGAGVGSLEQQIKQNDQPEGIQQVKQWTYVLSYQAPETGREEVSIGINLNHSPVMLASAKQSESTLLKSLAQFLTVWPALKEDFDDFLLKAHEKKRVQETWDVFVSLTERVVASWSVDHVQPGSLHQKKTQLNYVIQEKRYEGNNIAWNNIPVGALQLTIVGNNNDTSLVPTIEGYETITAQGAKDTFFFSKDNGAKWMKYQEHRLRSIMLQRPNVLIDQSIQATVSVIGNRNLKQGMTINPLFVYETPVIELPELFVAYISNDKEWNIGGRKDLLPGHLQRMFERLFSGIVKGTMRIKLECRYRHVLSAEMDLTTYLPVLMVPDYLFNILEDHDCRTPASFVSRVTNNIQEWQNANHPSTLNAIYLFDITVFNNQNPTLPMLRYENLYLNIADITTDN